MFHCSLSIIAVSDKTRLEAALKSLLLPEDCSLSASTAEALTEKLDKNDTAVIFDGIENYRKYAPLVGGRTLRVLLVEGSALAAVTSLEPKPQDLWAVPEGCDSDELFEYYGERLANTMKGFFDYRMQTKCMNTAFDSIPDLVWFKDTDGAHLMVNNAFCEAVAKTKEQIYKRGHYYIWDIPKEEYEQGEYVCLESEAVVMNSRQTCLFDEKVRTKMGMRRFRTYKSPLIDEDGKIFGTCGIANDVTAQHNINSELDVILNSIPFAILVENEKEDVIAANRLFYSYFPDFKGIVGNNIAEWKNAVLRGKLEESELEIETEDGIISVFCQVKPIFSIFDEFIGNVVVLIDVTGDKKRMEQSAISANTDFLTGLNNRRRLFEYFDSIKYSPELAFVLMDLDEFRKTNENYGQKAGDMALEAVAELIKAAFPIDFAARISGDNFVVVINGDCTEDELIEQSEQLLRSIKQMSRNNARFGALEASIGAVISRTTDGNPHDIEVIINKCNSALSSAKNRQGKICVCQDIE